MNVDDVVLSFTPGTLTILNVVLGLIMFGIALDTSPSDFRVVAKHPKPFVIAILAQLLLLPIATFALTLVLPVPPSMALGMLLVACCPPGNISQVLTHRAGGNVALSVSLTAVGNLIYIFAMPLSITFWGSLHPTARTLLRDVAVDPWLLGFIIAALVGNWAVFVQVLGIILIVVAVHDAVALGLGYGTAVIGGLGTRERKAMTFEVGIRNAGLGLGLVFLFFDGLGGMAVVAGWWGIWDIIAGLVLAGLWARHTRRRTGSSSGDASGRTKAEAA